MPKISADLASSLLFQPSLPPPHLSHSYNLVFSNSLLLSCCMKRAIYQNFQEPLADWPKYLIRDAKTQRDTLGNKWLLESCTAILSFPLLITSLLRTAMRAVIWKRVNVNLLSSPLSLHWFLVLCYSPVFIYISALSFSIFERKVKFLNLHIFSICEVWKQKCTRQKGNMLLSFLQNAF